jgi:hypothetical protein
MARDGEARQRQIAQDNAAEAQEERQRAEVNFGKARRAVDEYLSQVTENELLSVPGLQTLREELLQAALKFYSEFTQERADDPTLKRELASAHYRLGMIQRDLGRLIGKPSGCTSSYGTRDKWLWSCKRPWPALISLPAAMTIP